jgi:hypothetical protein
VHANVDKKSVLSIKNQRNKEISRQILGVGVLACHCIDEKQCVFFGTGIDANVINYKAECDETFRSIDGY